MGGTDGHPETLRSPIAAGEVRNPEGKNQYTYRREAERNLERWCRIHGKTLIEKMLDLAAAGKPWAMKLALERILPVVQEHKHRFPDVSDAKLDAALDRFLIDEAQEIPGKSNGSGEATP